MAFNQRRGVIDNMAIVGRACDRFFAVRGMPVNSGGLAAIIHRQSQRGLEAREKREALVRLRRENRIEDAAADLELG